MGGGCFGYEKGIRYSQIGDILRDLAGFGICEVFYFCLTIPIFLQEYTQKLYIGRKIKIFLLFGAEICTKGE